MAFEIPPIQGGYGTTGSSTSVAFQGRKEASPSAFGYGYAGGSSDYGTAVEHSDSCAQ